MSKRHSSLYWWTKRLYTQDFMVKSEEEPLIHICTILNYFNGMCNTKRIDEHATERDNQYTMSEIKCGDDDGSSM